MANFFKDNADLQFYVDQWIDWNPLVELTESAFAGDGDEAHDSVDDAVSFYRDMLDMVGSFVGTEIAPHAAAIDHDPMELVNGEVVFPEVIETIFTKLKALELHGMCLPRTLGGMNCPLTLYMLNSEMFARADVSTMTHHGFHGGMAMAMLVYSLQEGTTTFEASPPRLVKTRFNKEIKEIASGEAWGCMDITEPDAGSDMAALRCRGEQAEDGSWTVTGTKIFITSGHGKYHFVIARTEAVDPAKSDDPFAGLGGLSMFLVPTYEDVGTGKNRKRVRFAEIGRLEEKIGHKGSATCQINFDATPAQLIGDRGEGFKYMLLLMNNARVGVGFECIGLCEAALRMAKEYAAQRRSMGKTIDRHEMIADYIDEMESDIVGLRAIAVTACLAEEMNQKTAMHAQHLTAEGSVERARAEQRVTELKATSRRMTPLLKYLAAEKSVEMARRNMQIHGGVGYTKDYGAERLLRDALVMPIYEGTSQIQSLMVMKDTLGGIMKAPQEFVTRVAQTKWRTLSARDPLERGLARLQATSLAAQQHLMQKTATHKIKGLRGVPMGRWQHALTKGWNPKKDFAYAMLHAERLTRILADELVCELLWEQAQRHPERRIWLERYLERAEPRAKFLLDEITHSGARLLASLSSDDDEAQATG